MANHVVLKASSLTRQFKQADGVLEVLNNVSLTLIRGEMVGLIAPSGAGKSTLLHLLGLLDVPSSGSLEVMGQIVHGKGDKQRTRLRLGHIGFVYQFHHLLPEFTAIENVMMPLLVAGKRKSVAGQEAKNMLDMLGLGERLQHRPAKLSGGEQQRVAIARALITKPDLLLADEPTGNLDPKTASHVFEMLVTSLTQLEADKRPAMLLATHNVEMAKRMSRVMELKAGELHAA